MALAPDTFGQWMVGRPNSTRLPPPPNPFTPILFDRPSSSYMLVRAARTAVQTCASRTTPRIPSTASFSASAYRWKKADRPEDRINYNDKFSFSDIPDAEHANYKRVTANDLEGERHPPRRVKMLVRDFIEDSLYNPNYGYFSKQANIFTSSEPIDLATIRNTAEFEAEVAKRYASYGPDGDGPGKQLWHTPTELLKVSCTRSYFDP